MKYQITKPDNSLKGEINLPPTKRINNRFLVIRALRQSNQASGIVKEDWKKNELKSKFNFLNFKKLPRETKSAIRYLKMFFMKKKGEWVIYGSKNLRKGPVMNMIKAFEYLGANFRFEESEEFQPIQLTGSNLKGQVKQINATISRELVTVKLFMDPNCSLDKAEALKQEITNSSFINITIKLMKAMGITSIWTESNILVENEFHDGTDFSLEPDWGMATYWYEKAALASKTDLIIKGLNRDSLQAERRVCKLFKGFGVNTHYTSNGIHLTKGKCTIKRFEHDFSEYPTLIPVFAVTCAAKKIPFKIKGIDKIDDDLNEYTKYLSEGLKNLGIKVTFKPDCIEWNGKKKIKIAKEVILKNLKTQRVAMAFYPMALAGKNLTFFGLKCVPKSLPEYYDVLKEFGFIIS